MSDNLKKPTHVTGTNRLRETIQIQTDNLFFRPSIYGILIEDNAVLLSRQWGDGYDFPGGGIEVYETFAEALKREFWEETGLHIEPVEMISLEQQFYLSELNPDKPMSWIGIFMLCKKVGGELSLDHIAEDERQYIDMPEWVSLDRIAECTIYNGAKNPHNLIKQAVLTIKS